jgi:hypothetical protein
MITSKQRISAGMVQATQSWRRLLAKAPSRSTHRIIDHHLNFPELGFLCLLEKVIGPSRLREVCPLVVPFDADLAKHIILEVPEKQLSSLLHDQNQSRLYRLLWRCYYRHQLHIADLYWPTDIGDHINDFLEKATELAGMSTGEWSFCKSYLDVKYGLKGESPVDEDKKIFEVLMETIDVESSSFTFSIINQWNAEAHAALANNNILPRLETIAGAFHSEHRPEWNQFSALATSAKDEELANLSLSSSLSTLLAVRTANAFEEKGFFTFIDIAEVSEAQLREIPNIGNAAIIETREALRKVVQVEREREDTERQKLKAERRRVVEFERAQKARNA